MTAITIIRCGLLAEIPALPDSVTALELSDCTGLKTIGSLGKGLAQFRMRACHRVTCLPELPLGLESLDLDYNRRLLQVPSLGPALTELFVCKCYSLQRMVEIPTGVSFPVIRDNGF